MGNFVILRLTASKIYKNYNFNCKKIIQLGFDLRNKHTPLKNIFPSWDWAQNIQIPNQNGNRRIYLIYALN